MQVFEFHFNPKAKEDKIFDSFLFEPENILERELGSLYLVGEINNILPQNFQFLERISLQIKKEYYKVSERSTELALRESLRKANEFLSDESQKGNINWLGNLSFVALSIKDSTFNFATVGNLKTFLLREGEIFDIGKNLEFQEIEPYPLKIFGNTVSGKLAPEDRIIVLSKDIFEFFSDQNLIDEIAKLEKIEEKKLKNLLKNKENLLGETSGICLLIDLKKELKPQTMQKKERGLGLSPTERHIFEKIIPFSFSGVFSKRPRLKFTKHFFKIKFPVLKLPRLSLARISKIPKLPKLKLELFKKILPRFEKISIPKIRIGSVEKTARTFKISERLKKNLIIISVLILILLLGNFVFSLQKEKEIKNAQAFLKVLKSEMLLAEGALILDDEKKASNLYQQTWQKILPQIKVGGALEKEFSELKEEIEGKLFSLNKLEKISGPETFFNFEGLKFIPQKMIIAGQKLYFFVPTSTSIYQISIEEKTGNFIETGNKMSLAAPIGNTKTLFYSRPNTLSFFQDTNSLQFFALKQVNPDFYFNDFSTYKSNLYFLDSKKGEIIRYLLREGEGELSGDSWLSSNQKRPIEAVSMSIDGSIWILNNENTVDRFHSGQYQESLVLDFFPHPKEFSKILTSPTLPYLYLLEPIQNRIVVLDKTGRIIKQFQSEKFDNLKDFAISEDGKTIYLLNGLKVYQVKF
ncbi:hypothetical protein IH779_03385 [Patescibacteria group bacterium]|nr:hypothetical protein [Patescibacteria group bacterium]